MYHHTITERQKSIKKYLRNEFIRLIFPFSFTIVILFWLLVLLGDEFQSVSGINDLLIDILLHGIIFIFIIIDMFLYTHVYQPKIFLSSVEFLQNEIM